MGTMLVSFDIDGTMEFGQPAGPVTVELVRSVGAAGHVIGSASDRTRSDQSALWDRHGVEVAFVGGKHHLATVRERFPSEHHVHIGDTHVDEHFARLAGFEFVWMDDAPERLAAVLELRPD
jgi:hypothetical protein